MRAYSIPVRVSYVSLTALEEVGFEPSDEGKQDRMIFGSLAQISILSALTKRQREVAVCLGTKGFTRKETAIYLGITHQAIHQIIPRMRKRLLLKARLWNEV